jgi:hypothetical protein
MNLAQFKESLSLPVPPATVSVYLQALWYDGNDDWEKSHNVIQDLPDTTASWIHAYLHRKEGDIGNADYWYRKAGRTRPAVSLQDEWETIVTALL